MGRCHLRHRVLVSARRGAATHMPACKNQQGQRSPLTSCTQSCSRGPHPSDMPLECRTSASAHACTLPCVWPRVARLKRFLRGFTSVSRVFRACFALTPLFRGCFATRKSHAGGFTRFTLFAGVSQLFREYRTACLACFAAVSRATRVFHAVSRVFRESSRKELQSIARAPARPARARARARARVG
jgi:hypothetical protein